MSKSKEMATLMKLAKSKNPEYREFAATRLAELRQVNELENTLIRPYCKNHDVIGHISSTTIFHNR